MTAFTAHAQPAVSPRVADFAGARTLGMGAHRAVSTGNDAVYMNPAGLAQGRKYAIEGVYLLNPAAPSNILNFSVVDSDSGPIGTGAAYTHWSVGGRGGRQSGSIFNLAFGYPLMPNVLLGMGFKYLSLGQAGPDLARLTIDVGLMLRFSDFVHVGLVGYNLYPVNDTEAPTMGALAASVGDDDTFRLAFDWVLDFTSRASTAMAYRAGAELFIADSIPLRAGYSRDVVLGRNYVSAGLGLVAEGMGLDLAYKRQIHGAVTGGLDHSFAASVRLQLK